jgi:hypothetical protein
MLCPSAIGALTLDEDAFEVDGLVRSQPLSFLSLRDFPVLREGRLWSTIAVTEKTSTLRGLSRAQARHFIALASRSIKTSLTAAGTRHRADLQRLAGELTQVSGRFFRQSQLNDWLPRLNALVAVLRSPILRFLCRQRNNGCDRPAEGLPRRSRRYPEAIERRVRRA